MSGANLNNIILLSLLVYSFNSYSLPAIFNPQGVDHAPLSEGHINDRASFIDRQLKHNGQYDPQKILAFIARLKKEQKEFQHDVYETKIIEKLELDLKSWKAAEKKAEESSNLQSRYQMAFTNYLLPLMETLYQRVQNHQQPETWEALVAEFVRGYTSFYVPNAFRTVWPFDIQMGEVVKRALLPQRFKRDEKRLEANNLQVSADNIKAIEFCLRRPIKLGSYLRQDVLENIMACGIDISKFDPGVSMLWKALSPEELQTIHQEDLREFPREDQSVKFKKVILRGQGSPKLKVSFPGADGKAKYLKLKIGNEVHTDRAVSKLLELGGFNQDQMLYRKKIRVDLGKTSYDEFKSLYANKYNLAGLERYIFARGGSLGSEWIIFKDVVLEAKPDYELRLGPVDFGSWDLMNRREFRSFSLYLAWLGVIDTKLANFRFALRRHDQNFVPLVRMQDMGFSLAPSIFIRKPRSFFVIDTSYTVNEFDTTFIASNAKRSEVRLLWNDFARRSRNTVMTTYNDLKWLARKIAAIKSEDIYQALIDSGMPEPVAKVYHLKLLHRRNHMLEAFALEDELPLLEIPNLKDFNPYDHEQHPAIKNGQVTQTAFKDKTNIVHPQKTWVTVLMDLASFNIPVYKWAGASEQLDNETSLKGVQALSHRLGIKPSYGQTWTSNVPLGIGLQAVLSRKVEPSKQIINYKGKNHLFQIVDQVTIRFDLNSPFLNQLLKSLKYIGLSANIKFFEQRYEFIHYSDHGNKAYLRPFLLHKILSNIEHFAAYKLDVHEVIKCYSRYGLESEAGVGVYLGDPFLSNEVGGLFGRRNELAKYYFRDQFQQLHIYVDQLKTLAFGFNLDILTTDFKVGQSSLLKLEFGKNKFRLDTKNLLFKMNELNRDLEDSKLSPQRRQQEYQVLNEIKHNKFKQEKTYDFVTQNFKFDAQGKVASTSRSLFWLFSKEKQKITSTNNIVSTQGKERHFLRMLSSKRKSTGIEQFNFFLNNSDALMKLRKRIRIESEIDRDYPQNFIAILRSEDFFRDRDKDSLLALMNDLNRRYGNNETHLFYDPKRLAHVDNDIDFKQIYALTRVFINGKKLLISLKNKSQQELKNGLNEHFSNLEKEKAFFPQLRRDFEVRRTLTIIKKIQNLLNHSDLRVSVLSLAKLYHKLLKSLKTEYYGLSFLKSILTKDDLFVMSDIAGVHASYSTSQDIQEQQRRRFAATSWGSYHKAPPIQKFLRYERLVRSSMQIQKLLPDQIALGFLEVGIAPNLYQTFDGNSLF